ncbi:Bacterial extracellular solute-binding protein, family 3 [Pseudodesulfovibrio hydrargyri]|uniref:Bacterial extracellular solute-binding protein, family 3 n=1 Tax=Pseudodesulfovibrio hydrargyri TaxID=2125990 RepID=A0A1J5N0A3_9BACT|nr:transporter substrate-binding domain-containing protein [Pseudodesulfovibrio hydrargyri]OIQ51524.1 Bacterial extracellular solute-binding protein, family 3 [Pseudodesulfovibrio hydrargyri]
MKCLTSLVLLALLLPFPAYARDVDVATSMYCPLACDPSEAPHDGIMHEVLRRTFEGTKYRLIFHEMPYVRAIQETLDGRYDAISYAGTAHAEDFIFVRNLDMINVVQFATRADSAWQYQGVESLDQIRFSIPKGFRTGNSEMDDYLARYERDPSRIKMTSCDNPTMAQCSNLECMLNDRIDAMLVGSLAFRFITRQAGVADRVRVDPEPVAMFYNRIAFSPRSPDGEELRGMVERKIREMRASGELKGIFDHYGIGP